jgi:nicotinamidase-related amidase
MTTGLLVIDVQQILCSGPYAVFEADRMIDRINSVIRKARVTSAPVVIIQHETEGGLFAFESEGWQLAKELEASPDDVRIRKKASDSFHETGLDALLRARGVTDLVVCGLQSEYCVDSTTRRALALGYPVTVVADGHSTLDSKVLPAAKISAHHNETLGNIGGYGASVKVVPADEVQVAG